MKFKHRPWGEDVAKFVLSADGPKRKNIFAAPGMGKTGIFYDIFDTMRVFGEAKRALVLAPRRVAQNSWPDEQKKWSESFGHLSVAVAIGSPAQRLAALRQNADITCINYDNIQWLLETYGDQFPFDTVAADESSKLRGLRISLQKHHKTGKEFINGQGGKRSKALASVAHTKVRNWLNMTGSPAPNGLQDLWGQTWFIDGGVRLGRSFTSFSDRWFRPVPGSDGYSQIEPFPHAQKEIEALIKDISITVDPRDYFDLRETFEHVVTVQLPPKARASYREMERQLFTEIQSGNFNFEIEAFNGGGRMAKCLQIGNGAAWCDTERTTWAAIHDEKLEALASIVEETNGTPLLIRYCNVPDKDRILKANPKFKFLDNNPQTVRDFQDGKIRGLVTHAASAGHGLSLQDNCWTMVDYSTDCNLEHDEQIIERIGPMRQFQSGYTDRQVKRYRIIAEQTIEERICLPRIKEKMTLQDAFKAAMKII